MERSAAGKNVRQCHQAAGGIAAQIDDRRDNIALLLREQANLAKSKRT